MFPLAARAIGVIASIAGVYAVKAKEGETNALKPINRGFLTAGIITVVGVGALALGYVGNDYDNEGWKVFGAVVIGLVLAQVVSRLTEYFTATHHAPVKEIAESTRTGPATAILSGTSTGMESSVYAIIAIALAIGVALALGGGNLQFSLYLVALCGMGMLATTGVIVSEDTFGPVSDNAAGIAEMSGEFHGEPERIMVSLDAVGNTTKAVTKGFAIGSAVIASVAIFASFIETAVNEVITTANGFPDADRSSTRRRSQAAACSTCCRSTSPTRRSSSVVLIGGAVPFLFSALAINAVSRTAGVVVQEVRRQFADGLIMKGEKKPDHGPVIDICTAASLRELVTPALLAVLTPVIIGFGIGFTALGAFLVAVILVGQLMANYLSNAGGAWDNAKKYIEDGNEGGKGSDAHKAAVIADTVGDPFKDTAGPALNPLIKVMNLVSLLMLPAIINMSDIDPVTKIASPTGGGIAIAGVALVILIGSVAFSKRKKEGFGADEPLRRGHRRRLIGRRRSARDGPRRRRGPSRVWGAGTVPANVASHLPPRDGERPPPTSSLGGRGAGGGLSVDGPGLRARAPDRQRRRGPGAHGDGSTSSPRGPERADDPIGVAAASSTEGRELRAARRHPTGARHRDAPVGSTRSASRCRRRPRARSSSAGA